MVDNVGDGVSKPITKGASVHRYTSGLDAAWMQAVHVLVRLEWAVGCCGMVPVASPAEACTSDAIMVRGRSAPSVERKVRTTGSSTWREVQWKATVCKGGVKTGIE